MKWTSEMGVRADAWSVSSFLNTCVWLTYTSPRTPYICVSIFRYIIDICRLCFIVMVKELFIGMTIV